MKKSLKTLLLFFAAMAAASCATLGRATKESAGPSGPIDHETQYRVACHEAGHTVVAAILRPKYPLMAIVVRTELVDGSPFGTTNHANVNRLETVRDILEEAAEDLAGREAEVALLGEPTNGGTSDLIHANRLFRSMCTTSGLCGSLLVEETPSAASNKKIARCLDLARARARVLVKENSGTIRDLAGLIMSMPEIDKKRMLETERLRTFLKDHVLVTEAAAGHPPKGTCP